MLTSRSRQRWANPAVRTRRKPARQTTSTPARSSAAVELGFERLTVREPAVIDGQGRDAGGHGTGEARRLRPVAHHQRHLERRGRLGGPVEQRLQVGPAARDQDGDAALAIRSRAR